jgi:hypothetical protein
VERKKEQNLQNRMKRMKDEKDKEVKSAGLEKRFEKPEKDKVYAFEDMMKWQKEKSLTAERVVLMMKVNEDGSLEYLNENRCEEEKEDSSNDVDSRKEEEDSCNEGQDEGNITINPLAEEMIKDLTKIRNEEKQPVKRNEKKKILVYPPPTALNKNTRSVIRGNSYKESLFK